MDRDTVPGSTEVLRSQIPERTTLEQCIAPKNCTPSQLVHCGCALGYYFCAFILWEYGHVGTDGALLLPWLFFNFVAMAFDNTVLCCGSLLGAGVLLDTLSRVRFFLYVLSTPMLLMSVCELVSFCDDSTMDKFAVQGSTIISRCMLVLVLLREALGLLRGVPPPSVSVEGGSKGNPGRYRPGDCLASEAMLGGAFRLYSDGTILRYSPFPRRKNYTVPAGIAFLASLWLGCHLFFRTGRLSLMVGTLLAMGIRTLGSRFKTPLATHVGELFWSLALVIQHVGIDGVALACRSN